MTRHFFCECTTTDRGIRFDFTYKDGQLASVQLSRIGFGNGRDILSRLGGGGTLFVFCDQVGTPKLFTDTAGRHIKEMSYDSFGIPEDDTLPELFIPVGFAGGLVDEDTGLVRFGFRDYDPLIGRFTCPDPAKDTRGDGDLYDYCVDDPVNNFDPLGLWTKSTFSESKVSRDGEGQFSSGGNDGAKEERTLLNALANAPGNIPSSFYNLGNDIVQAVINPKQTIEGMACIITGYATQLLGMESDYQDYSEAVTAYFRSRYGSWENCKETLATDPVGFFADISTGLSGGGGLIRAGGTISKAGRVATVGKVAQTAGSKLDVLQQIGAAVGRALEKKFPQRAKKIAKAGVVARVANSVGQKAGTQRSIDKNREKKEVN